MKFAQETITLKAVRRGCHLVTDQVRSNDPAWRGIWRNLTVCYWSPSKIVHDQPDLVPVPARRNVLLCSALTAVRNRHLK